MSSDEQTACGAHIDADSRRAAAGRDTATRGTSAHNWQQRRRRAEAERAQLFNDDFVDDDANDSNNDNFVNVDGVDDSGCR